MCSDSGPNTINYLDDNMISVKRTLEVSANSLETGIVVHTIVVASSTDTRNEETFLQVLQAILK